MTLTLFVGLCDLGWTAGGSTRRGKPLPLPLTVGSTQSATGIAGPVYLSSALLNRKQDCVAYAYVWEASVDVPRIKLFERRGSLSGHEQGSKERRCGSSFHLENTQGLKDSKRRWPYHQKAVDRLPKSNMYPLHYPRGLRLPDGRLSASSPCFHSDLPEGVSERREMSSGAAVANEPTSTPKHV